MVLCELPGRRRSWLAIKRAMAPLVDVCNRLMRFDSH
jgi:hypothetical protein